MVSRKIANDFLVFLDKVFGHGILRLGLVLDRFLGGLFGFIYMRRRNLEICVVLLLVSNKIKMNFSWVFITRDSRLEPFVSVGLFGKSISRLNEGAICKWGRIEVFNVILFGIDYRSHRINECVEISEALIWKDIFSERAISC